MFFHQVKWSPVEEDYLKLHREDMSENQLSLALGKSRNAIKRKLMEFDGKPLPQKMSKRSIIGKRKDLGQFFRSAWEANCARVWNAEGKKWEYEPRVFVFPGVKRGTVSYCPDFRLAGDEWVEIKGLLDGRGRTAIRRFKKHYPDEFKKLKAIVGRPGTKAEVFFKSIGVPIYAYMNELDKKHKATLPNWE